MRKFLTNRPEGNKKFSTVVGVTRKYASLMAIRAHRLSLKCKIVGPAVYDSNYRRRRCEGQEKGNLFSPTLPLHSLSFPNKKKKKNRIKGMQEWLTDRWLSRDLRSRRTSSHFYWFSIWYRTRDKNEMNCVTFFRKGFTFFLVVYTKEIRRFGMKYK